MKFNETDQKSLCDAICGHSYLRKAPLSGDGWSNAELHSKVKDHLRKMNR